MVDKEKVLVGLESCADRTGALCRTCPYDFVHNENCMGDMARDALQLIKDTDARLTFLECALDFAMAMTKGVKQDGH